MTFIRTTGIAAVVAAILLTCLHASGQDAAASEWAGAPVETIEQAPATAQPAPTGAEVDRNDKDTVAIIGVLMIFGTIIALVTIPLLIGLHRAREQQKTARLMVEKGQPVPLELLKPQTQPRSDLRKGIVLVSTGIGLCAFLLLFNATANVNGLWAIGLIPGVIGIGHLVVWKLESKNGDA